jgi:hypothetical protein
VVYFTSYPATLWYSTVDIICVPYEEMECITDFKIVSMSTISNVIAHYPDSLPDHSLLYCDIKYLIHRKYQRMTSENILIFHRFLMIF